MAMSNYAVVGRQRAYLAERFVEHLRQTQSEDSMKKVQRSEKHFVGVPARGASKKDLQHEIDKLRQELGSMSNAADRIDMKYEMPSAEMPPAGVPEGPGITFGPGGTSKRSSGKAAYFMLPFEILREVAHRYFVGQKYGVNNWKRAGEDGDIGFIRQAVNHDMDHTERYLNFFSHSGLEKRVTALLDNAGYGSAPVPADQSLPLEALRTHLRTYRDDEGETRFGHAIARVWNSICLAWYEYHYPELTAKAFYNDWRGERDTFVSQQSERQ